MGMLFNGFSMKIAGFKCIGNEPQGFDELRSVVDWLLWVDRAD